MSRVAIKAFTFADLLNESILKQEILFFDKVLVPKEKLIASKTFAELAIRSLPRFSHCVSTLQSNLNTLEYLQDIGSVELISQHEVYIDPFNNTKNLINFNDLKNVLDSTIKRTENSGFAKQLKDSNKKTVETTLEIEKINCDYISRMIAIKRNFYNQEIIFPLLDIEMSGSETFTKKNEVYRFILSDIAIPTTSTSWKNIVEFKNSQESKRKLYHLIDWVNTISHSEMAINEIIDRYRFLYAEYEHQLNLHQMKYKKSTLEVVVNTTLEIIENALKLKISKIAKALFSIKTAEIGMMEEEANIFGREVAYIFDVKNAKQ